MSYIGQDPRLRSIVSTGDTLANLNAQARIVGRLVYATDTLNFYADNGTDLVLVGDGRGFDAVDTKANLDALARELGKLYYASDELKVYADNGVALAEVGAIPAGGQIEIFNAEFIVPSGVTDLEGLMTFRAPANIEVLSVQVELFETQGITSGLLVLDVKKNSTLDDVGMVSILTAPAEIDFSTASNYDIQVGSLDAAEKDVLQGEILRLDITKPAALTLFRVTVYGG